MLRIVLFVILFSQAISGFSKGNYFFPEIAFKDIQLKEINKESALKIIKRLREYGRIFGPTDIFDRVNHFYRSDIDGDNKSELIYYGLIDAGGLWSIIWKVDQKNYHLFGELFGEITGISDSFHLSTWAPGRCGSEYSFANLYRIVDDEIDFVQCAMVFNGVKIPDSLPIKKKIIINDAGYSLRAQPIIIDAPDSTYIKQHGVLRGNAIVELNKGTIAWATAMHKDATGNIWRFLILDNPAEARYNIYKNYKNEKRRICGWINTTHLDYKEIDQDTQD